MPPMVIEEIKSRAPQGEGWKIGVFIPLPGGIYCNPITPMLNISIVWSSVEISP